MTRTWQLCLRATPDFRADLATTHDARRAPPKVNLVLAQLPLDESDSMSIGKKERRGFAKHLANLFRLLR